MKHRQNTDSEESFSSPTDLNALTKLCGRFRSRLLNQLLLRVYSVFHPWLDCMGSAEVCV